MSAACEPAHAIAVIPARYGSQRVPGKALAAIAGRPMVEHVLRRAQQARSVQRVIVATDDERIRDAVAELGEVAMTDAAHESGSDRVAEVARAIECDIVVNVQGDLPLLDPAWVDKLVAALDADPALGMATLAVAIVDRRELDDPGVVKVVVDGNGRALYFSRAPIPHDRDDPGAHATALHHIGIYAYRREILLAFAKLAPTRLERVEKLEQLRALENGIGIGVVVTDDQPPMEVDTEDDLEQAREAVHRLGVAD